MTATQANQQKHSWDCQRREIPCGKMISPIREGIHSVMKHRKETFLNKRRQASHQVSAKNTLVSPSVGDFHGIRLFLKVFTTRRHLVRIPHRRDRVGSPHLVLRENIARVPCQGQSGNQGLTTAWLTWTNSPRRRLRIPHSPRASTVRRIGVRRFGTPGTAQVRQPRTVN